MHSDDIVGQFSAAFEAMGAAWVMWLLIILSILSVAVMIERCVFFMTHQLGGVRDEVRQKLKGGDFAGAVTLVADKRGLEAEVVRQGVKAASLGTESVGRVVEETIVLERLRYERWLSYLGTLGNNAPFIGLFGTVLGIVSAFAELAKNAQTGSSMTDGSGGIMSGISEALVATAVGLLVALPAVAAYNAFGRWLKTVVARSQALALALESHLTALPDDDNSGSVGAPRPVAK